jgi:hypothetical protein
LSAPVPLAFGHTAAPPAVQVQVALTMPLGNGSLTTVFGAATLPVLLAVIV